MGSNIVNYVLWLLNLVRSSLMMMMTFTEVKGPKVNRGQMWLSVIWLPHLVRCNPNIS